MGFKTRFHVIRVRKEIIDSWRMGKQSRQTWSPFLSKSKIRQFMSLSVILRCVCLVNLKLKQLRNPLHAGEEAGKRGNPLWIWNLGQTSQEVQNGGISGPTDAIQKLFKNLKQLYSTFRKHRAEENMPSYQDLMILLCSMTISYF